MSEWTGTATPLPITQVDDIGLTERRLKALEATVDNLRGELITALALLRKRDGAD